MVLKIIAIVLAAIIVLTAGYLVVKTVINLFAGYSIGDGFSAAWHDVTHLWGLIKDKAQDGVLEFPMANQNITWTYTASSVR